MSILFSIIFQLMITRLFVSG